MLFRSARVLVLNGTSFLGRAIATAALAAGYDLTLFNRGITNPDLFPEAEKLRGDRTSDLTALAGRDWDVVIDVAAYRAGVVGRSVAALGDHVGRYVFVSTLSVYADHSSTDAQREDAAVLDVTTATEQGELYGAHKAACERVVRDGLGERATIVRAGMIAGPHDRTSRFTYWPRRLARGGRVLAPGHERDPLQFIDVRDLATWLVHAGLSDTPGTLNVTGLPLTFAAFLDACTVPSVDAELVWVASDRLLEAGVDSWMGVPLWLGAPGWDAANAVDVRRAVAAGLTFRPLAATIAGALAHPGDDGTTPFSADDERRLLALSLECPGVQQGALKDR